MNVENNYLSLSGTPKQIEWADNIRRDAIKSLTKALAQSQIYRFHIHELNPSTLPGTIEALITEPERQDQTLSALSRLMEDCQRKVALLDRLNTETSAKWIIDHRDEFETLTGRNSLKNCFGTLFLQRIVDFQSVYQPLKGQ